MIITKRWSAFLLSLLLTGAGLFAASPSATVSAVKLTPNTASDKGVVGLHVEVPSVTVKGMKGKSVRFSCRVGKGANFPAELTQRDEVTVEETTQKWDGALYYDFANTLLEKSFGTGGDTLKVVFSVQDAAEAVTAAELKGGL